MSGLPVPFFTVRIASGGNVPIRNAGYHAAVMQIDYGAIIPYAAILQEKICKVSSPFLVNLFCLEILVQQIIKNLVYCAFLVIRLLPSNNGMKIQLLKQTSCFSGSCSRH